MVKLLESRIARWMGWLITGFSIIVVGIGLALQTITGMPLGNSPFLVHYYEAVSLVGFAIVGALIVSRHPRHPIGWIWLLMSISFGADHFAWGYASYGYVAHPGSLPGVKVAIVWLYSLGRGTFGLLGITLLMLLFPSGRPLSRRWGILAWIAVGRVILTYPVNILDPRPIIYFPFPTNLFTASKQVKAVLTPLGTILSLIGLFCVVASIFSLFLRLIQAKGVERQQIKMFAYVAAFFPPAFILIFLGGSLQSTNWLLLLGASLGVTASIFLSIASAIAIFRYRLWDIDLIIRRTLIYSVLTAALTLIYLSSVVTLQFLFGTLIGERRSAFVTVLSTLVSAALFVPMRHRVQYFIGRKFYRRKYDAERVLTAFSNTLRHEVDMDHLTTSFLQVVTETMQPAHVSFWFRESPGKGGVPKEL